MKCCKTLFPVLVVIILYMCPSYGEKSSSSKARKRYRSHLSVVSKTDQDRFPSTNFSTPETIHNETPSPDFQPTATASRAMPLISDMTSDHHRSGLDSGDRDEDLFQPFTDFGSWGHYPPSQSHGQGQGQSLSSSSSSGSKHTSPSLKESDPVGSPRYSLTSAEKFDKYGSGHTYSPGSNPGPIYSSYPLAVGGGLGEKYQPGNPLLDTYPYYDKEREREQQRQQRAARDLLLNAAAANKLNALNAMHGPAVAAAASTLFGNSVVAPEYDGYGDALALASGGHGHGHGWGWGWEPHHHDHGNDVNTSAVGLLGLLGLLSLLSNILLILLTTTTTAAAARKKRSTPGFEFNDESDEAKRTRVFYALLPFLSPVTHWRNGAIPTDCILQGVCLSNKVLVKEYGLVGRTAGSRVTEGIVKLHSEMERSNGDQHDIHTAALHGRNQRNCQKVYPVCKPMQNYGHLNVPFNIKMDQVPHYFERLKKQTSYSPMNL